MDSVALSVSSLVNTLEELRLPSVSFTTCVKGLCVAIPTAVLLHDTAHLWMPQRWRVPVLTWFRRRWASDPESKEVHLATMRKVVLLLLMIGAMLDDKTDTAATPMDYLQSRTQSATAVRSMNEDVHKARAKAFNAAVELLGEEEMNMEAVVQQRDAALHRRYLHDSRLQH